MIITGNVGWGMGDLCEGGGVASVGERGRGRGGGGGGGAGGGGGGGKGNTAAGLRRSKTLIIC